LEQFTRSSGFCWNC